jgi:hypothetical protein
MKQTFTGEVMVRNTFCWRAITATIENWKCSIDGARVETAVSDDQSILTLTLGAPGLPPVSAEIDICWIAYPDQAERLALQTHRALEDLQVSLRAREPAESSLESSSNSVLPMETVTNGVLQN